MSLYAFILSMLSFDLADLPAPFLTESPRKTMAGLMFLVGAFLTLAWLGRILPPLLQNSTPALENTTTLVIQANGSCFDCSFGCSFRDSASQTQRLGILLGSVFILKSITMGLGVSAMGINMALKGVQTVLAFWCPF
jgi:hypothetical protein